MRGFGSGMRVLGTAAVVLVCGVLIGSGMSGCRKGGSATPTEANGFVCPKCQLKFYTDWEVLADKCPGCGNTQLKMVIGYPCAKCGKVILDGYGAPSVMCPQCKEPAYAGPAPTEQQLVDWGAVKKSKSEVTVEE